MGTITPDLSGITDGTVADAADFTTPLNTIINEINGNLDSNNIANLAVTTAKISDNAVTSSKIETQESWNEIGAAGKPSFLNSWVNFGNGYANAAYMKDSLGFVHLRGMVSGGTSTYGTTIFTLPAGYRPSVGITVPSVSNRLFASIVFDPNGTVQIGTGTNTWLSLDGIIFKAEA